MEKYTIDRNDAVLVIVDVQERLAAVMDRRQSVLANCRLLIEGAEILGVPVVLTEQYSKGLGPTEAELRRALPAHRPIEKLTFSCCGEETFTARVDSCSRRKVILAGMEAHVCVLQTALDLLAAGYGVHLVGDAVCSRAKENWRIGIDLMRDAGAVITSTETVLFQLLERAGTPEFKAISKRLK